MIYIVLKDVTFFFSQLALLRGLCLLFVARIQVLGGPYLGLDTPGTWGLFFAVCWNFQKEIRDFLRIIITMITCFVADTVDTSEILHTS